MATLIKVNGEEQQVLPKNGRDFKLHELYELLGCETISILPLQDGSLMVIDDEGKLDAEMQLTADFPVNLKATEMYLEGRIPALDARIIYSMAAGDRLPPQHKVNYTIAGTVLVGTTKEIK